MSLPTDLSVPSGDSPGQDPRETPVTAREWQPRGRNFDASAHQETLLAIFAAVSRAERWDRDALLRILAQHPRGGKGAGDPGYFSKIELVEGYRQLTAAGFLAFERNVLRRLQMKPVRTSSGVAPVTVLTEPAGCPGRCIFCPDADGMPKSYLPNEPGARRAAQCGFDPYLQVRTRLATFAAMGHTADKVELLILGGTWSAYARTYREWFVRRCLDAMNAPDKPDVILNDGGESVSRANDLSILSGAGVGAPAQSKDAALTEGRSAPFDSGLPPSAQDAPLQRLQAAQHQKTHVKSSNVILSDSEESASLTEAQARNETAAHRNVGLVIETRPDWVTPAEIHHLRRLGVTKVQLGVQSLDDRILALNQRGHNVAAVRRAVTLLRAAGFKLHLHWMPNLFGATPQTDRADFSRLWADPALRPDELKIYPCSIIAGTELYRLWQAGQYRPYTDAELLDLVADCKTTIPPYCRVNRVFRDIPADDIVAGVTSSNLRQLVHDRMAARGQVCRCIRCREVRHDAVGENALRLVVHTYETAGSREEFLSYETTDGRLAGFLRLSLPLPAPEVTDVWHVLPEIAEAAMIREVHIYGPALEIGAESDGEAQHLGLGRRLIAEARRRTYTAGFARLAVISAIGTRRYYEKLGFERGKWYMITKTA